MQAPLPMPSGTINEAKQNIAVRHLVQLAELTLKRGAQPTAGEPEIPNGLFGSASHFDDLVQWSNDNKTQIAEAVKDRAFGGPDGSDIKWTNVLLGCMEAATVYLRDSAKVIAAAEAYKQNDFEAAFRLLEESTKQIQEVAALWGMKFQLLCDLTESSATFETGPYCGAFYSENPDAPFIGVAFKHEPAPAMDLIRQGLNDLCPNIPNKGIPVMVHVAGHSFGGSYSNLCYNQFTIPAVLPQFTTLGDLYTF
ncbi:unnamed protein product, partial [Rhizoctonia solani]